MGPWLQYLANHGPQIQLVLEPCAPCHKANSKPSTYCSPSSLLPQVASVYHPQPHLTVSQPVSTWLLNSPQSQPASLWATWNLVAARSLPLARPSPPHFSALSSRRDNLTSEFPKLNLNFPPRFSLSTHLVRPVADLTFSADRHDSPRQRRQHHRNNTTALILEFAHLVLINCCYLLSSLFCLLARLFRCGRQILTDTTSGSFFCID
ncbi:hypothetical protein B0T20DRAFT_5851 [Sordaria brevicollis]|uniref:Uncharacterized protein n=1 Tax=Sordaria brevicollis TaxID=83679 RepID=A0AAE0PMR4_SORBR|nr:hypothetical protein B0T20DRAFT_5851 [Sordaria brevicollis]